MFRALVGWGVVSFAVLQIIEPVMHGLHWSDAVLSYVVVALAVGFPVVVGLAWVFDLRAGAVERTPPAPAGTPWLRGPRLALLLFGLGNTGCNGMLVRNFDSTGNLLWERAFDPQSCDGRVRAMGLTFSDDDLVVTGDMQGTVDLGFGPYFFPQQTGFYLGLSM